MGVETSLIQLAVDGGIKTALDSCESIHESLETVAKIGSVYEVKAASFLLDSVNQAIQGIQDGVTVTTAASDLPPGVDVLVTGLLEYLRVSMETQATREQGDELVEKAKQLGFW